MARTLCNLPTPPTGQCGATSIDPSLILLFIYEDLATQANRYADG